MQHHVHILSERHRDELLSHFLQLGSHDRHLRFGSAISDSGIAEYAASIDFTDADVFAVFDDTLRIIGAVHLHYAGDEAELGLSVIEEGRGQGIGNALFERATVRLSNRFIRSVTMHCLRENHTIMHLARKNGMRIVVDGSEADAWLELPDASPGTVTAEWIASRLALFDYTRKIRVHLTRSMFDALRG